jgi:hypothetical protein
MLLDGRQISETLTNRELPGTVHASHGRPPSADAVPTELRETCLEQPRWIGLRSDGRVETAEIPKGTAPTSADDALVRQIGATVDAYCSALEDLLRGKYAQLREWVPAALLNPEALRVFVCDDGVVVRFDRDTESPRGMVVGRYPGSLTSLAPVISQGVVRLRNESDPPYTDAAGPTISIVKTDGRTGEESAVATLSVCFEAILKQPSAPVAPSARPTCLVSIESSTELSLLGRIARTEGGDFGRNMVIRTVVDLPVVWSRFEVYPFVNAEQWKPELALAWAEHDILASAVAAQFRENSFQTLDPHAGARRELGTLLKRFRELLDSNPDREEALQEFLCANPRLLCPMHTRMWPKLALGNRKTDFVFRYGAGDYLLVELEKSTQRLFRKDGQPCEELNHARNQVTDWRRYLEDNLSTVQRELGLTGISVNPQSLIAIGRSSSLSDDNRRKLAAMENESPKSKILTYDDINDSAKAVIENILGPLNAGVGDTRVYYFEGAAPDSSSTTPTP